MTAHSSSRRDATAAALAEALAEMERRWTMLEAVFDSSACYAPQDRGDPLATLDAWSPGGDTPRRATPAYVWLRCLAPAALDRAAGETCYDRVLAHGVRGANGASYGDTSGDFMRLEVRGSDETGARGAVSPLSRRRS